MKSKRMIMMLGETAHETKIMPEYYILKCRIHKGTIYSITENDDICGGCAKKKKSREITNGSQ